MKTHLIVILKSINRWWSLNHSNRFSYQSHTVLGVFPWFNVRCQLSWITSNHKSTNLSFFHKFDEFLSSRMTTTESWNIIHEVIEKYIILKRNLFLGIIFDVCVWNKWSLKFLIFIICFIIFEVILWSIILMLRILLKGIFNFFELTFR